MRWVDLDDLISLETVSGLAGVCNPKVLKMVEAGELPEPVRLGKRCVMWSRAAVQQALPAVDGRDDDDEKMNLQAAAAMLGVSVPALRKMTARGEGPPIHRRHARSVYCRRSEVLACLSRHGRDREAEREEDRQACA